MSTNKASKMIIMLLKFELLTILFAITPILVCASLYYIFLGPLWKHLAFVSDYLYNLFKWNEWLMLSTLTLLFMVIAVASAVFSLLIFKNNRAQLCFNTFSLIVLLVIFSSIVIVHLHTLCYI